MNQDRLLHLAGILVEAKKPKMDPEMAEVDADADMDDMDDADKKPKKEKAAKAEKPMDDEEYPAAVLAACKKLSKDLVSTEDEKKMFADEEALCECLMKVYNAGMKAK